MLKVIKESFHGKGHQPYTSKEAKKAYANSLLKLSSHLTITAFAGVGLTSIAPTAAVPFWAAGVFSLGLMVGAVVLRHKALLAIDLAESVPSAGSNQPQLQAPRPESGSLPHSARPAEG